jgi:dihydrodipicolinate synthase/N-acetylneuraminate lyase
MAAALFTGAGVALVTLFDDDGRLLVEETVEHAVDLVERGIAAVVDAGRLVAELGAYDGPLYVGSSAYLALAGPLGATGAILSLANTDPEGCIAALAGDMEAQRALLPGHRESRVDFPAGLKRRLARMAGTPAAVRAS